MIDLSRTRAGLLEDIQAPEASGVLEREITAPEVLNANVWVRLRGRTEDDLFPVLKVVLSERFADVPRSDLVRDLLMPLKHGIGNAYKRGNRRDLAKQVTVELILTGSGALLAITDEGAGFDVGVAVERMRQGESYFFNQGAGLRGLHNSSCVVTWENGGRTLVLCYRPSVIASGDAIRAVTGSAPVSAEVREDDPVLRRVLDPAWIETRLYQELPASQRGGAKLESCHAYLSRGPAGDDCGIRYVLRVTTTDALPAETHIFTGRLYTEDATAAADFEAALGLHRSQPSQRLRVPEPVARLMGERLVLYNFDPWMNLWQYLAYRDNLDSLRHSSERAGDALALLHRSRPAIHFAEPGSVEQRFKAMGRGAVDALEGIPGAAALVGRFRLGLQQIQDQAPVRPHRACAPIHGALGWDRIHFGADSRFYLYRFESCQLSDPAIDLGGYAADLLRFTLSRDDPASYRVCRDQLLSGYNSQAEHPIDEGDLPFYIALALGERLRDGSVHTKADAEHLLAALDAAGSDGQRY